MTPNKPAMAPKEPEQKPKSKWDYSDEYNDRQWMRTVGYGTPDGRHFKDDNDHSRSKTVLG